MNDTDLDLIIAIADGRLTGQAEQDALTRISSDPELSGELAAQISAMDELKMLEPALMTASERTALRNTLIEQLNLSPAAPVAAVAARRPWWQPVLGLASAAAVIILIVALPSVFTSSDDSSADFVALAPGETTSTAAATEIEAAAERATPTSPVLVPHIAREDVEEFFDAPPPDVVPTEEATGSADAQDEAQPDTTVPSVALDTTVEFVAVDTGQLDDCLEQLRGDIPVGDHIPTAVTLSDDATLVHFGIGPGEELGYSVSIDLDTCTLVSLTP